MKQLVILSGKGGTGKTSLTAAFAHLAASALRPISAVLADADVDAANLELVLEPRLHSEGEFWGGKVAQVDEHLCSACGDCIQVCRFDAIRQADGAIHIDAIACEGCAACVYQCPNDAIRLNPQMAGSWYHSASRFGPLFHAALRPAQENSGRLVTLVKQHARLEALDEDHQLLLVDGPPGTGCPVISAASGADLALIVAEPSVTGVHDMLRVLETTEHFGIEALVCTNKADIFPEGNQQIQTFCREHEIDYVGSIPYDPAITEAMIEGEPVTAFQPGSPASKALVEIWQRVVAKLYNGDLSP